MRFLKNIICLVFALLSAGFIASSDIYAGTCEKRQKRWNWSQFAYNDCLRKEDGFWSWAGRPWNLDVISKKPDAYFIPDPLLVCNDHSVFVAEFNRILNKGGKYTRDNLKSGCEILRGSGVGRIAGIRAESNVVQIQYIHHDNIVFEKWTHIGLLTPMSEHLKKMAR